MDFTFGKFFLYLRTHAKGGSTANCEYIANHCQDDIIILGSSRATHHYVPKIIEDSLDVTCYNCGEEGNGIVLAYGRLKMLADRYSPKLVLYEITPSYDIDKTEPNNKYLGYLRAYYYKDGIKEIFDVFDDDLSWLKMMSKMYQNKSRLLPNVIDNVIARDNNLGYAPLFGRLELKDVSPNTVQPMAIDDLKLYYIQKMIDLCKCKNIPLVFMISPEFEYGEVMVEYEPVLSLCKKNHVLVYNSVNEQSIVLNPTLFHDVNHLNDDGAKCYTRFIIPFIKQNIRGI